MQHPWMMNERTRGPADALSFRPRRRRPHRFAAGLLLLCHLACARVDPTADFQKASQSILERTGYGEVYDPATDALVEARVNALLAGGLTVDDAVRVALLNNKAFQASFQAIGASRADVVQSGLLSNPTLTLLARFPEGGGRANFVASFGQEIADLWQIPVRRRIAQADLDHTIQTALNRGIELIAEVRTRAFQVLGLQRAEAITRENLDLAQRGVTLAQERFNAGEVSQLDVALVRGHMLDVRQSLITVIRDREAAQVALEQSLGLSRRASDWELRDALAPVNDTFDEAALLEQALRQRFDIKLTAARVDAAELQVLREYYKVFPSVTVGAELERLERRALPGRKLLADTARASVASGRLTAPSIQSRGDRRRAASEIIDSIFGPSISLTLPIFDQNQAQIAKARYLLMQARKDLEEMADSVARQVREAVIRARAAATLIRFYDSEALPLANESLENARRLYRSGEQGVLVLLDAEQSLVVQRRAYVDALRDAAIAGAELERAIGGRPLPPSTAPAATQPAASQPSG